LQFTCTCFNCIKLFINFAKPSFNILNLLFDIFKTLVIKFLEIFVRIFNFLLFLLKSGNLIINLRFYFLNFRSQSSLVYLHFQLVSLVSYILKRI